MVGADAAGRGGSRGLPGLAARSPDFHDLVREADHRSVHGHPGLHAAQCERLARVFTALHNESGATEARMIFWSLLVAAGALSVERFWYAWVWYDPESFRHFCSKPAVAIFGEPIDVLRNFFVCFKTL